MGTGICVRDPRYLAVLDRSAYPLIDMFSCFSISMAWYRDKTAPDTEMSNRIPLPVKVPSSRYNGFTPDMALSSFSVPSTTMF